MASHRNVEVCSFSLESCIAAKKAGAARIELCASPFEGGTTPPAGLVKLAVEKSGLPINVMVRPRGSDFCYDDDEYEVMKAEIEAFKKVGVAGIVLGILLPDGNVDTERTRELVQLSAPLPVTFHRAIDFTVDPIRALEDIIDTGCRRILTSGAQDKAIDGQDLIRTFVEQAAGRIEIIAGSGVSASNAQALLETGADTLHLTGKSVRDSRMQYRKEEIPLGGVPSVPEYDISFSDAEKIEKVVEVVRAFGQN